jgi:hypothetical protein
MMAQARLRKASWISSRISKDNFATGTLQPGQTTSGQIAFDVPAQHGIIVYSPQDGSGALAGWSF